MRILHVDENGKPDQSLGKVLTMVFLLQAVIAAMVVGTLIFIAAMVIGILMAVGVIPALW